MIMGMSEATAVAFFERVTATAIVNQAILKCSLAGLKMTHENVVRCVGDFADPDNPAMAGLIAQIDRSIDDVLDMARLVPLSVGDMLH
jgi:hypothetical protein